jgi:hypothetical protein
VLKRARNQCLLRYGRCSYSRCPIWFPCITTQLSALRRIEVRTLSKFLVSLESPDRRSLLVAVMSWSLISAEYTKVFRCPYSQNSRGLKPKYRLGQLTGYLLPIHCSSKVWFSCCLTVRRKSGGVASCINACVVVDEEVYVSRILVRYYHV